MSPPVGVGVNNCHPVADVLAAVSEAEQLGAEIAFISEDVNCRDAFQLAALSAARTQRIRIATGVVNPYTRNPTALAMSVATLDEISRGRATLGLGSGSPGLIEGQMGLRAGSTVQALRETAEIVRGLLDGDTVTYRGRQFTYQNARLEAKAVQAHLPIFFAAMGPRMLRLSGRMADGVLLNVGASTEYIRWAVGEIRAAATEVGRDPQDVMIAAWLAVYTDVNRASALARARSLLATMLSVPRQGELLLVHSGIRDLGMLNRIRGHYQAYPHAGDLKAAADEVSDEVAEQLTLVGTVSEVRVRIAEYRDAGVQIPVMGIDALRKVL